MSWLSRQDLEVIVVSGCQNQRPLLKTGLMRDSSVLIFISVKPLDIFTILVVTGAGEPLHNLFPTKSNCFFPAKPY